jgi:hypothetical protein
VSRLLMAGLGLLLLVAPLDAELVITDAIPGEFVDISASGTPLGLGDDGVAEVWPELDLLLTLFHGGGGRVWISNNGALGFLNDGASGAYYLNAEIPSFALFGGGHSTPQALAVYWDDLDSDTGEVYYATIGTPGERVFIVQWQDRPHYPGDAVLDGNETTFQVQIFEDATLAYAQLLYQDVDFHDPTLDEGASATIGYQAGAIGNHVQWSCNTPGAVTAGTVLTLLNEGCPWDFDGDGAVDLEDLACLLSTYGLCYGDPGFDVAADFNYDGCVDLRDLAALLTVYGLACP